MPFADAATVMADRAKQSWKLTTATLYLNPDHTTTVSYASVYVWPLKDWSGIGADGWPTTIGKITFYREGESSAPQSDDTVTNEAGSEFLIQSVLSRLNRDEEMGYAVYDCEVSRLTNE